jgi:hypothetical protein
LNRFPEPDKTLFANILNEEMIEFPDDILNEEIIELPDDFSFFQNK